MRDHCKNSLSVYYTCRDAIEDLNEAISKARERRNKEEPRRPRRWSISRKF